MISDSLKAQMNSYIREAVRHVSMALILQLLKQHMAKWNRIYEERFKSIELNLVHIHHDLNQLRIDVKRLERDQPIPAGKVKRGLQTKDAFKDTEQRMDEPASPKLEDGETANGEGTK